MRFNKIFLMFALLLFGAIYFSSEANSILTAYYRYPNETKSSYGGTIDINLTVTGAHYVNMSVEVRRTYNETTWTRLGWVQNSSGNQTTWNITSLSRWNTAPWSDGIYEINATFYNYSFATVGATYPRLSNVTAWTWYVDNRVPSATITSHTDNEVVTSRTQTFYLDDSEATNCTLTLWYNNANNYFSNTTTNPSGANSGTPGTRSCSITATDLPSQPIEASFISNDQANSSSGGSIKITVTSGSGGGGLSQQQAGLFDTTSKQGGGSGFSLFSTSGEGSENASGALLVILLIIIGIAIFRKRRK